MVARNLNNILSMQGFLQLRTLGFAVIFYLLALMLICIIGTIR